MGGGENSCAKTTVRAMNYEVRLVSEMGPCGV